jgi:hypothetical protein
VLSSCPSLSFLATCYSVDLLQEEPTFKKLRESFENRYFQLKEQEMILIACQSSDSDITLKENLMKGASKAKVIEEHDEKQFIHLFWSKEYFKNYYLKDLASASSASSSSSSAFAFSTSLPSSSLSSKKQLYQSYLTSIEKTMSLSPVIEDNNHVQEKDDGLMDEEIHLSPIHHHQNSQEQAEMMFDIIPSSEEKSIIGEKRTRFVASSSSSSSSNNHKKVARDGFSDSENEENGMEEEKKEVNENGKIQVNYHGRYEETQAEHYYDAMTNDDDGNNDEEEKINNQREKDDHSQQKNGNKRIKTTVSPNSLIMNPVPFPSAKSDLKPDYPNINDKDSSDDSEQEGGGEDDTTSLGSKQPPFSNSHPFSSQKRLNEFRSATINNNQGNISKHSQPEQNNGFGNFMNTVVAAVKPVGNKLFR